MSDTGDYMRAFEACFDVAEYAAALRLAHEFWGRLHHRCVWCGTKCAASLEKGHPLHLGPTNDKLTFRFCGRCYSKARKIVKANDDRVVPEWKTQVYGMGINYKVHRREDMPIMTRKGLIRRRRK